MSKESKCTAEVVVRKRPGGAIVATKTLSVAPGTRALPTAKLTAAAKQQILAGSSMPVTVTVSNDQHYERHRACQQQSRRDLAPRTAPSELLRAVGPTRKTASPARDNRGRQALYVLSPVAAAAEAPAPGP